MMTPAIINIELTNRCNMECVFCDHASLAGKMRIGEMGEDILRRILDSVGGSNIYELGLVGLGEPLLDKDLVRHLGIIAKYKNNFTRISLNSNATVMNKEKVKLILGSCVNLVTFSLNATNPASYKRLMGHDLFNTSVRNIKDFIDARNVCGRKDLNVSIQFMSSDMNEEHQMNDIFKGYVSDNVVVYNRYVFNKPALEKAGDGRVNINKADFAARHPCWSLYSRVYIDIDGNLYPCTIGNDCYREGSGLCIGNVKKDSVADIFNNGAILSARRRAEDGSLPFPECEKCTLWELFPNNFELTGSRWIYREHEKIRRKALDRKD